MTYPILDPATPISALGHLCALAVMAKAPRPGRVKTRLSPPLTLEQTAALNICFLKDTTENLASIPGGAGLISYTPAGDEALFDGLLPETFGLVLQRGDGFGERLLAAAQDILAIGYGAVCLIDSDSPTVPAAAFRAAVEALGRAGDRVVLGPSHDGGYYLIGLKRAHAAPFERITWSTGSVLTETLERCREAGLEVVMLPTWYDVDDEATLEILTAELFGESAPVFTTMPGYAAPHTREFLAALAEAALEVETLG
jgi:rSAM/selenodomain-associated transferase 1